MKVQIKLNECIMIVINCIVLYQVYIILRDYFEHATVNNLHENISY